MTSSLRPTIAEINIDAIKANLYQIRKLIGPKSETYAHRQIKCLWAWGASCSKGH